MVVLDLFSGAGGLSEGFFRVGSTFVGHVEADAHACKTLKTRTAYWNLKKDNKLKIYNDYLLGKISTEELWKESNVSTSDDVINESISDRTFSKITKRIKKNLKSKKLKKVDVIIGGPPCQAYSVIGRARMKGSVVNDPRNFLYKYYVNFLEEFKPKMFIFENVMGLKTAGDGDYYRNLKDTLDKAGYHIEENIMYANDYGVLQSRKRIIIVGWKKDKRRKNYPFPEFEKIQLKDDITVNDVLKDLPITYPGNKIERQHFYRKKTNEYLKISNIREENFNILTQHETRPHNKQDIEIYKEAIIAWDERKERLNYSELAERRPDLITHKNTKTFTNRFNVIKANEKASHTILAHMAMDGHYYIHPDVNQLRSLSIREAARLQSFPDDFFFEGPRTSIFRQIGNAVPPKMAEQIAKKIIEIIN